MLRPLSLALALSLAAAAPALARRCPTDMATIDKAFQTARLSPSERRQVVDLRTRGEEAHKAGNHTRAERLLEQAKEILKIRGD